MKMKILNLTQHQATPCKEGLFLVIHQEHKPWCISKQRKISAAGATSDRKKAGVD